MTKLFVGGFPLDMSEMELVKLISPYGTVDTIKIVRDKKTRKCKGYAFIEMTDLAGAQNAIEALDGAMLENRQLTLNITLDKPASPPISPVTHKSATARPSGYVKNAPSTEEFKKKRPRK